MKTLVISAHAGLGKTTFANKNPNTCIDLESSIWSKIVSYKENGEEIITDNPNFPLNYVEAIKQYIGKYKYIFISPSLAVQLELQKQDIFYYIIYPTANKKKEYLERYKQRGSNDTLINFFSNYWDHVLESYKSTKGLNCIHIETEHPYIDQVIRKLNKYKLEPVTY